MVIYGKEVNNKNRNAVLIAVLLGWCGGYRFYKRQYALGILYLFTCGLFFVGWIVDIAASLSPDPAITPPSEITRFHTKVVGVTYPTTQGGYSTRQEALSCIRRKDTLSVEYFDYNGEPAYRIVLDRNHSDIGNLSADLARETYRKYKNCTIKIVDWEITGGDDGRNYGCNIELAFYKN